MTDTVTVVLPAPEIVVVTDNTRTGPKGAQGFQGFQGVQGSSGFTTFDGGGPLNNYAEGPAFDCGGVT